jgi:hypothetical protein
MARNGNPPTFFLPETGHEKRPGVGVTPGPCSCKAARGVTRAEDECRGPTRTGRQRRRPDDTRSCSTSRCPSHPHIPRQGVVVTSFYPSALYNR